MNNSYNPGLLFYKHYYKNFKPHFDLLLSENKTQKKKQEEEWKKNPSQNPFYQANRDLFDFRLPAGYSSPLKFRHQFTLQTTYPGLLIGTGYPHGSGVLGEFKIGFYFDHTTGLPIIPGSSVKGLLRGAFPCAYKEKSKVFKEKGKTEEANLWANLADIRATFINVLLKGLNIKINENPDFIEKLEKEIFEGWIGTNRNKGDQHFPMSQRDIFYDATVVAADKGIFGDDYITPHKNPLKNPTPIQLMKVLPKVTFQFQFDLKDKYLFGENQEEHKRLLKAEERLELFRQILLYLGAGAKTNVGYGQWVPENHTMPKIELDAPALGTTITAGPQAKNEILQPAPTEIHLQPLKTSLAKLKQNAKISAKVIDNQGGKLTLKLSIEGYDKAAEVKYAASEKFQIGSDIQVNVASVTGKSPNQTIVVNNPQKKN